ncbi:hypothetical protein N7462_003571 [Penicillium macrosclerotiorum]|uniref:uncharacterized protein n=1 Tax=Penicillium macrosclerotiorum TaxID=303699 RepID=UPI002546CCF4|nr:uncharacterized protein N7462_003571 [Penicillium macrosclerotiorum]KAJ5689179.1 hypothetical protein N7462_003571 [Penicillium macrosclerotiorum]
MVLLTSSQVSAIVSMGVVCIFTLLLFVSGYVLQQNSVKNIQHALRRPPDIAGERRRPESSFQKSAHKRGLSDSDIRLGADQGILQGGQDRHGVSRGNYAYLQLLARPDPSDICSAVLFFKQLATNGSAIQDRLFMYPEEWDRMSTKKLGKPASLALSILRAASMKYGIWLLPIDMSAATTQGFSLTDTKLLRLGQIQFMQYDSVLYLQSPGLILDTEKLDKVLLSQPLPLIHDLNRPESYNNEAWTPMALRPDRDAELPPAYLITVNNVDGGRVQTRTHVPNTDLDGFGNLITGPWGVHSAVSDSGAFDQQGYVYFENDRDGQVKWAGNPLFGTWRSQQHEVCEGLNFDDDFSHDGQ